jgi:hypothetical protein
MVKGYFFFVLPLEFVVFGQVGLCRPIDDDNDFSIGKILIYHRVECGLKQLRPISGGYNNGEEWVLVHRCLYQPSMLSLVSRLVGILEPLAGINGLVY